MDRLDGMQVFVRVVETGSFSKAAAEFQTTQPTVTKQVAALEARLKVRLLNRNTRGVSLSEPGALFTNAANNCCKTPRLRSKLRVRRKARRRAHCALALPSRSGGVRWCH